jgi:hypothetical protein
MPSQRSVLRQRKLTFDPISTPTRQTPRTNRTVIPNCSQYVRVNEPIENPPKEQHHPLHHTANKDIYMVDREQDDGLLNTLSSSDEGLGSTETPTRKNRQAQWLSELDENNEKSRQRHVQRKLGYKHTSMSLF